MRADTPKRHHGVKSMDALISEYLKSQNYLEKSASTRHNYKRIMKGLSKDFGKLSSLAFEARHIRKIMHNKQDTPDMANRLLSVLNILFKLCIRMGWREDNPCTNVENYKTQKKGFPAWSHEEINKYLTYWPQGSEQRLAFLLLYFTRQRSGDVFQFGFANLIDFSQLKFTQGKTNTTLILPLHPELKTVLEPVKNRSSFIHCSRDQPFSSAKAFQQWFVKTAKKAGVENRSAHGLRKSFSAHLIDAGASEHEVMAATGHKTSEMVRLYTKSASQEKLALSAIDRLESLTDKTRTKEERG